MSQSLSASGNSSVTTAKVHDIVKDPSALGGAEASCVVVLVDRMWPRGVAKDDVPYDEWFKDVAPTPELRKWWNHREEDFDEFTERYWRELDSNDSEELEKLQRFATEGRVVLLFAAKNRKVNHAVVLAEWLNEQVAR